MSEKLIARRDTDIEESILKVLFGAPFQLCIIEGNFKKQGIVDAAVHGKNGDVVAFAEREKGFAGQGKGDDGVCCADAFGGAVQQNHVGVVFSSDEKKVFQKIEAKKFFQFAQIVGDRHADQQPFVGDAHILRKRIRAIAEHIDDLPDLLFCFFADFLIFSVVEDVRDGRFTDARCLRNIFDRNFFIHDFIIG